MQDLTATLVQANLAWEQKEKNLLHLSDLLKNNSATDLIVLPEMFSTGFTMDAKLYAEPLTGSSVQWMKDMARNKNAVVTGSLIIEENQKYYNRLIWMQPDGDFMVYDKRHAFSLAGEDKSFSTGNRKIFPQIHDWKLLPLICYDLRFPVWSRQSPPYTELGRDPYHALVYVANWPDRRIYAWQQLLVARAIENQCYVIGVNRVGDDGNNNYYSGHTCLIDPMGERLFESAHDEGVETISLSATRLLDIRDRLPFLDDRDEFELK